ncbi:MAG: OmpA family protein [Desulfoarculaceae bacterium]|nr:OmpA family protein [Desulfoarculaceae bacterium]
MKKKTLHTLLFLTLIGSLTFVAGGCSKKEIAPPTSAGDLSGGNSFSYPDTTGSTEGTLDDTANQQYGSFGQGEQGDEYKRQHGRSSAQFQPVYFNFDESSIRQDMINNMIANAEYMKTSSESIIIEGNTDERGTNEYNLALGERRAISAKRYLVDLGIDSTRIRTISYGEERPLFEGQDENSYQYNRRDDFVID